MTDEPPRKVARTPTAVRALRVFVAAPLFIAGVFLLWAALAIGGKDARRVWAARVMDDLEAVR